MPKCVDKHIFSTDIGRQKVPSFLLRGSLSTYCIPPPGFSRFYHLILILFYFPTQRFSRGFSCFWALGCRSNKKNITALWAWFRFYLAWHSVMCSDPATVKLKDHHWDYKVFKDLWDCSSTHWEPTISVFPVNYNSSIFIQPFNHSTAMLNGSWKKAAFTVILSNLRSKTLFFYDR